MTVIVVAPHREHAIMSMEPAQDTLHGIEFHGVHILNVTRKDDGISVLSIDAVYGSSQDGKSGTGERTHMGIGKLSDAIAIKSCRQIFGIDVNMGDTESTESEDRTIDEDKKRKQAKDRSDEIAPIFARMTQTAIEQTQR